MAKRKTDKLVALVLPIGRLGGTAYLLAVPEKVGEVEERTV